MKTEYHRWKVTYPSKDGSHQIGFIVRTRLKNVEDAKAAALHYVNIALKHTLYPTVRLKIRRILPEVESGLAKHRRRMARVQG